MLDGYWRLQIVYCLVIPSVYVSQGLCVFFNKVRNPIFLFLDFRDYSVASLIPLTVENLEETGHFLGQSRRITLCEANCKIV